MTLLMCFSFQQGSGAYCNATFDGYLCWPPTVAGGTAKQNCPRARLSDTSKLAYRKCDTSGLWVGRIPNETSPIGWTNYTECYPTEVRLLFGRVDKEAATIQEKFEIAQYTRYVEIVGFSGSFIMLSLSLITFSFYKSLRNNRTRIHKSLFTAMLLQVILRLILYIDQELVRSNSDNQLSYTPGIDNIPYLCEAAYTLLEYANTVMFMWMFIEGLYLHNLVTDNALRDNVPYHLYSVIGWGVPVIITVVWATLTAFHYQDEAVRTCWYGYNFLTLYWIMQGPRLAIILINFSFLLNIMRVLIDKMQQSENTDVERIRYWKTRKAVRAALVLLPLLGITNALNMIEPPLDGGTWQFAAWSYITHFLRSFQGIFVSLIYCFMNTEVRQTFRRHYNNYRDVRSNGRRRRRDFMDSSNVNRHRFNIEQHQEEIPMRPLHWINIPSSNNDAPVNDDMMGRNLEFYRKQYLEKIRMRRVHWSQMSASNNDVLDNYDMIERSLQNRRNLNDEAVASTSFADGLTAESNFRMEDTENV